MSALPPLSRTELKYKCGTPMVVGPSKDVALSRWRWTAMSMDCSFRDMRLTTHPMGSALWISSNDDGRSRCVVIGGIAGKRILAHPNSWLHVLWFFVHFASQEDWVHEAAQASKS